MPETTTKAKPILFSSPMVNAILAGTKTQTRRAVKPQPDSRATWAKLMEPGWEFWGPLNDKGRGLLFQHSIACPYGKPGDFLYVKEALYEYGNLAAYVVDGTVATRNGVPVLWPWKVKHLTGRYMPRWASRITLEATDLRVQRVRDISEEDAIAEGVVRSEDADSEAGHSFSIPGTNVYGWPTAVDAFEVLWRKINGDESWTANPWVWAITFRRITNA